MHLQLHSKDAHQAGNVSFESHANKVENRKFMKSPHGENMSAQNDDNEEIPADSHNAPNLSKNISLISDPVDQVNALLGFKESEAQTRNIESNDNLRRADSSEIKYLDTKGIPQSSNLNTKEPRLKPNSGMHKESFLQQAAFHKVQHGTHTPKGQVKNANLNQS